MKGEEKSKLTKTQREDKREVKSLCVALFVVASSCLTNGTTNPSSFHLLKLSFVNLLHQLFDHVGGEARQVIRQLLARRRQRLEREGQLLGPQPDLAGDGPRLRLGEVLNGWKKRKKWV